MINSNIITVVGPSYQAGQTPLQLKALYKSDQQQQHYHSCKAQLPGKLNTLLQLIAPYKSDQCYHSCKAQLPGRSNTLLQLIALYKSDQQQQHYHSHKAPVTKWVKHAVAAGQRGRGEEAAAGVPDGGGGEGAGEQGAGRQRRAAGDGEEDVWAAGDQPADATPGSPPAVQLWERQAGLRCAVPAGQAVPTDGHRRAEGDSHKGRCGGVWLVKHAQGKGLSLTP